MNKKTIFFVGGTKGGVGKSTISIFLIDYFLENNKSIALCETDNGNPDVYKVYQKLLTADNKNLLSTFDISKNGGWVDMFNFIGDLPDDVTNILINTKGGNIETIDLMIKDESTKNLLSYDDLINFHIIWVVGDDKDGISVLLEFLKKTEYTNFKIDVLLNNNFQQNNDIIKNSELQENISKFGGNIFNFPKISRSSFLEQVRLKRTPISEIYKTLKFGDRIEMERYRKLVSYILKIICNEEVDDVNKEKVLWRP